ncbi:MAG TPA: UDP-N-acetylmuramoyl-L-alanine--D-glutamate ligase [Halanaerobiales bacterium]|nr:UDP-N-acetylmuramoyl-L-alanine--D-glutamate ligase [Halanaerobiales bacterium]
MVDYKYIDFENGLKGQQVTVIGLSRTGVATAQALIERGAKVVVSDIKKPDRLKEELKKLKGLPIKYFLGEHPADSLETDLIVVSPGVPLEIPFLKNAIMKGIPVISEIELAYNLTKARIIAITGTNGKTTTTSLTGAILKKADPGIVKIAGNIGRPLIAEINGLTEEDWLVVEVSSFQLETISKFQPDISVYLNFSPDHLDRHLTINNYRKAKKSIFSNQKNNDYAVINYDDPEVLNAAADCEAEKYYISMRKAVSKGVYLDDKKLFLKEKLHREIMRIKDIPLRGLHNVQNVAFACMAAYLAGVDINLMKAVVQEYRPDHHRLEEIARDKNGTLYIDDSKATNPDAAIKGLNAIEAPIVLIAGGQDRNADFNVLAETIKKRVRVLILLGETKYQLRNEVLKRGFNNINIHIVENMSEAVKIAYDNLETGDCVLLSPACPSWDMFSSYQERGNEFQQEVEKQRGN